MFFGQIYFTFAYFQFNGVILKCTSVTCCTGFIHFSCLFSTAHFLCSFEPSGQVISVCISTVVICTTGLVDATAWAYVVFKELNMSISFLSSMYEICLSALIL